MTLRAELARIAARTGIRLTIIALAFAAHYVPPPAEVTRLVI